MGQLTARWAGARSVIALKTWSSGSQVDHIALPVNTRLVGWVSRDGSCFAQRLRRESRAVQPAILDGAQMKRSSNPMRRSWLGEDGGWIPHRLSLLMSPAWQHRPRPVARLLERIEVEHLRHGGKENGRLCASYGQFVTAGISRRAVRAAIAAACDLGLLSVTQRDEVLGNIRPPNEYRLTYVPEWDKRAPTDEWKGMSEQGAEAVAVRFVRETTATRKREPSALSCSNSVPHSAGRKTRPVPLPAPCQCPKGNFLLYLEGSG